MKSPQGLQAKKEMRHWDWCLAGCQRFADGVRHYKGCEHYVAPQPLPSKARKTGTTTMRSVTDLKIDPFGGVKKEDWHEVSLPSKGKSWEEIIMSLSEMEGLDSKNPVMAFPQYCPVNNGQDHDCLEGYVCHCDDSFLCEHRTKWLISFISSLLKEQRAELIEEIEDIVTTTDREERRQKWDSLERKK